MRRFGEGDRAIAQYVRKHRPEVIEEAIAAERRRKRRSAKAMRARRRVETPTDRKARELIAELASLGVFVAEAPKNGTGAKGPSRSRLQLAGK